jgi:aryl-phospho-beta-D-glucosidase BglC (GH1 family)
MNVSSDSSVYKTTRNLGVSRTLRRVCVLCFLVLIVSNIAGTVLAASAKTSLTLQSSPNPATTSDSIQMSGKLTAGKSPVSAQSVQIQYSKDKKQWITITTAVTGPDGAYASYWDPTLQGQVYLRASFSGTPQYKSAVSNVVTETVDSSTTQPPPTATTRLIGVNYLTLYHEYDTSQTILDRDFSRFKADGINTIVILLYWYRIESSQGVYNQEFIKNVIRVVNIANNYGLKVMFSFHTLIGQSDAWSNPSYVGVGMNLITNSSIAAAYVAMVKWTVTQLKGLPNVWAYSVVNEPWYWPLDNWRKANWISLIVELAATVKAIESKQVTVRFVGALFERDWGWDTKLLSAVDFISINAYIDEGANDVYWNTFDEYRSGLGAIAQKASALGKQVEITEFGYSTSDSTLQASRYQSYIDIFKSTPNLMGWLSWGDDSSYDPGNPSWTAISWYSIVVQSTGTPRPAYTVLVQNK